MIIKEPCGCCNGTGKVESEHPEFEYEGCLTCCGSGFFESFFSPPQPTAKKTTERTNNNSCFINPDSFHMRGTKNRVPRAWRNSTKETNPGRYLCLANNTIIIQACKLISPSLKPTPAHPN